MSDPSVTAPETQYATIIEALCADPQVEYATASPTAQKRFGADCLKTHNKIFAMLVKGRLVVKLPRGRPRQRVDARIAAGIGERFDPGHGRLMKEWVTIVPLEDNAWLALAREALAFVAGQQRL